jgi:hypothetical protein
MKLCELDPITRDTLQRAAIMAAVKAIGVYELDRARWVVAYRHAEFLRAHKLPDKSIRAILRKSRLPVDAMLIEPPPVRNIREEKINGSTAIVADIGNMKFGVSR